MAGSIAVSGNADINPFLSGKSWASTAGQAVTITYGFLSAPPANASAQDANGFATMDTAAQNAVTAALNAWAAVAHVSFVRDDSGAASLQFGTNNQGTTSNSYAVRSYIGTGNRIGSADVYLNNSLPGDLDFSTTGKGEFALLAGIGKALGFKLPGQYTDGANGSPPPYLPSNLDNNDNTVMSHNPGISAQSLNLYSAAPLLLDVQAIQYLYTPNMNYHTGNDAYIFTDNNIPTCIWDAGGINTLDFSQTTGTFVIDLHAGAFSSTSTAKMGGVQTPLGNVSIAYGTTIQNAIAGSGNGVIYANDAGDTITCGSGTNAVHLGKGNDTVTCGSGTDTVYIGQGNATVTGSGAIDVVVFSGASSGYTIKENADKSLVISQGSGASATTDHIIHVQELQFTDKTVYALNANQANIARLYTAALGREPDAGGLYGWELAYQNKIPDAAKAQGVYVALAETNLSNAPISIAFGFTHSTEFQQKYGALDDMGFVTQLYANVLGRSPDPGGLNGWLSAMHDGINGVHFTREMVLVGFAESPENIAGTAASWLFPL